MTGESFYVWMNPISALTPAAYYRFGLGITETGGGVSQWDDASGNGRHLVQASGSNRPIKQGDGSILFDGVSQYMKTSAFTLNQPETVYLRMKQVAWNSVAYIFDGNVDNVMAAIQRQGAAAGVSPAVTQYAGNYGGNDLTNMTIGSYHALAMVFNGASSLVQVDLNAPGTGDASTANAGGFTLMNDGSVAVAGANAQVKEVVIFASAHDAATRALVINYLNTL